MGTDVQITGKIYTTKQTAERLGITEHVLRYMSDQLEDMLEVGRDEQLNREYSENDIAVLKKVNKIREIGVSNYKAIKVIISGKLDDINGMPTKQIELENYSFNMGDEKLKTFANIISDMVTNNIEVILDEKLEEKLDAAKQDIILEVYKGNDILSEIKERIEKEPKLGDLEREVQELKKLNKDIHIQNLDSKKDIEYKLVKYLEQMELHFNNVDKKLMNWRDNNEKTKEEELPPGKAPKKGFWGKLLG
jgi:DNA-binding transcriptional MerR regulator